MKGVFSVNSCIKSTDRHTVTIFENLETAVRLFQNRIFVPGTGCSEVPGAEIQNPKPHGNEHIFLISGADYFIYRTKGFRGGRSLNSMVAEQNHGNRHKKRSGNAFSRHITDYETKMRIINKEEIEKVSSDFFCRSHAGKEVEFLSIREGRELIGEHVGLDSFGDIQLGRNAELFPADPDIVQNHRRQEKNCNRNGNPKKAQNNAETITKSTDDDPEQAGGKPGNGDFSQIPLPEQKSNKNADGKENQQLKNPVCLTGIKAFLKRFDGIGLNINALHQRSVIQGRRVSILHAGSIWPDQDNFIFEENRIYVSVQQIDKTYAVTILPFGCGKGQIIKTKRGSFRERRKGISDSVAPMLIDNSGKREDPLPIRAIHIEQGMTKNPVGIRHGIDVPCIGSLRQSVIRGIPTQNGAIFGRIKITGQVINLSAKFGGRSNDNISKLCSGSCQLLISNRILAFSGIKNIYPDYGRPCIRINIVEIGYCFGHIVSRPGHRAENIQGCLIDANDKDVSAGGSGSLIKPVRDRLIKRIQNPKTNNRSEQ